MSFTVRRSARLDTQPLHFDLSHLPNHEEFTLHLHGKRHALLPHTDASRAEYARTNLAVRHFPAHRVTHYLPEVALPADRIQLLLVVARRPGDRTHRTLALAAHHCPVALKATRLQERRERERSLGLATRPDPKLAMHGIRAPRAGAPAIDAAGVSVDYDQLVLDANSVQGAMDAATTLVMSHPELLSLDPNTYSIAAADVAAVPALVDLAQDIYTQAGAYDAGTSTSNWVNLAPLTDGLGAPSAFSAVAYTPAIAGAQAAGTLVPSQTTSGVLPVASTRVIVTITAGGGLGTAAWSYTVDGGATIDAGAATSLDIGYGITVSLAPVGSAATFAVGDTYGFMGAPEGWAWSSLTQTSVGNALKGALQLTKNDLALENWSYVIQPGTTVVASPPATDMRAAATGSATVVVRNITPTCGVETSDVSLGGSPLTLNVTLTNEWVRWLSVFVEFLDDAGNVGTPQNWSPSLLDGDTRKYLDLLGARDTILGIPLDTSPTELSFPWPTLTTGLQASGARLLAGGIGGWSGYVDGTAVGQWDPRVCGVGALMTGVLNFGLPAFFLVAGAELTFDSEMDKEIKEGLKFLLPLIRAFIEGPVASGASGFETQTLLAALANLGIDKFLEALPKLWATLTGEVVAEEALDAIPVAGWVAWGIATASDAALLVETTVEVLSSAPVIEIELDLTTAVSIQVGPDPLSMGGSTWPAQATYGIATLQYSDGTAFVQRQDYTPHMAPGPITVSFPSVPAGGSAKVVFNLYSDSDWLCGAVATPTKKLPINEPSYTFQPVTITQVLVPLKSASTYQFVQKLAYQAGVGHVWQAASPTVTPPTATAASLDPSAAGVHLVSLVDITISELPGALGYAWQSAEAGLDDRLSGAELALAYVFQTVSAVPGSGDALWAAPTVGLPTQANVSYELLGASDGTGLNYWLDSELSPAGTAFHLRGVTVAAGTPFDMAQGMSWGRFNTQIDSLALHPAGAIVGISTANSNVQILTAMSAAVPDASAPAAVIKGGLGTRPGLFHGPVAVCCTVDGRVLVLETAYTDPDDQAWPEQVQAIDIQGNPVLCFGGASTMPLKVESQPCTYLDMAVESMGYLYVLKIIGEPASAPAAAYAVDIYRPAGEFLVQTTGIAAGKLSVSLFRDLYALHYDVILGASGAAEPSVAQWSPPSP